MRYKRNKENPAVKSTDELCGNCKYCVMPKDPETRMGRCHRYPLASKCRPDHWCGEFKQR